MIQSSNDPLVNRILFLCDFLYSSTNGISVRIHPGIYWLNNNNSYSILTTKKINILYKLVKGHSFFDKKLKLFKLYYGEKEYHS